MRIGGSIGKLLKKVANTKVAGVSIGGGVGSLLGPLGMLAGQKARGGSLKQNIAGDLKSGSRNAAVISPLLSKVGTSVTNAVPPDAPGGDAPGGYTAEFGLYVTGKDAMGNKTYGTPPPLPDAEAAGGLQPTPGIAGGDPGRYRGVG